MRAWMFQLNPSKGRLLTPDGSEVPVSTENLFRYEIHREEVGGWYVSQFFGDAEPGDPLLIRVGGKEKAGIVAAGWLTSIGEEDGDWVIYFQPDVAASEALRANPISYERSCELIPKSQRNLVRLEPHWPAIEEELRRRGAEPVPNSAFLDTLETMDEEGELRYLTHRHHERRPSNRKKVLARAAKPYACEVCGFSFASAYGEEFGGLIEVHHLRPLSHGTYQPTPEDFALLCPNCHAAAHWKRAASPLSLDELRAFRSRGATGSGTEGQEESTDTDGTPLSLDEGPDAPSSPRQDDIDEASDDTVIEATAKQTSTSPASEVEAPTGAAIFVFRSPASIYEEADALRSIAAPLAQAVETLSVPVTLYIGEINGVPRELGHLILDRGPFTLPHLVGIVEAPLSVTQSILRRWQLHKPQGGLSCGSSLLGGEALELVPRLIIRDGRALMSEGDMGVQVLREAGLNVQTLGDFAFGAFCAGAPYEVAITC